MRITGTTPPTPPPPRGPSPATDRSGPSRTGTTPPPPRSLGNAPPDVPRPADAAEAAEVLDEVTAGTRTDPDRAVAAQANTTGRRVVPLLA